MNIADHTERGAREYPDRPALLFEGREITYRELDEASSKAAGAFTAHRVKRGDRVALLLPNIPDFVIAYLGILKLGAIAVSINPKLQRDEVGFIVNHCGPACVVTTPELSRELPADTMGRVFQTGHDFDASLDAANPISATALQPGDPAAIVYTSGTAGRPKGATLSHRNIVRNIEAKRRYLGIRPDDRALLFLPLYHCFGQNAVLNAVLQAGATVVLHRRFKLEQILQSIATDAVTMFFGVPTTYILLLDQVSAKSMLPIRYYFSAAAPLPVAIEQQWTAKFRLPIFQGYGLTETSPFASYNHLEQHRPGSIGTPIEGVEMKIVDPETGHDAAAGEKGEIVIRGHNVMLGYWNEPEATARAIRNGWFHTGDIGKVDGDGYYFIEDRLTDVIISGGVNIYPAEIENVLHAHAAVAEATVYGMPEPLLGEHVWADVVLRAGALTSKAEILAFCRARLADVKVPAFVRFVNEIPKSPTGKILKRVLREQARVARHPRRTERNVSERDVEQWIHGWLTANLELLDDAALDHDPSFAGIGMDSLVLVRLVKELGEWLERDVEITAVWNFPTPKALAAHVSSDNGFSRQTESIANLSEEDATALLLEELEELNR